MNTWRVYNAIHEGEWDSPEFDLEYPWYVALDTEYMTFEIAVRFPSEEDARVFIHEKISGAVLEENQ